MADLRLGDQGLQNFTPLMTLVPRVENMLEKMGLFDVMYSDEQVTAFERIVSGMDSMYSVARGADRQVAGDDEARTAWVEIPFFTLDKIIKPKDVQALREFATAQDPETVRTKAARVIARIQKSHAKLHQKVMYQALKGSTYAVDANGNPRPNLQRSFQAMFEILDADMYNGTAGGAATYDLTNQALNPSDEFEKVRKHVFNKAGDLGDNYEIVGILGTDAFTALKNHTDYVEAFANYASQEEPLRQRLGGLKTGRVLRWQGITYLEDVSGEIAADTGYFFPRGVDEMFHLAYSYSDTIAGANREETISDGYLFIKGDERKEVIESEVAVVAVNTRPDLVASYTFTV